MLFLVIILAYFIILITREFLLSTRITYKIRLLHFVDEQSVSVSNLFSWPKRIQQIISSQIQAISVILLITVHLALASKIIFMWTRGAVRGGLERGETRAAEA